jgi:hypothetical protein
MNEIPPLYEVERRTTVKKLLQAILGRSEPAGLKRG